MNRFNSSVVMITC